MAGINTKAPTPRKAAPKKPSAPKASPKAKAPTRVKSDGFKSDPTKTRESQEQSKGRSNQTLSNMFAETEPTANTYEPTESGEPKSKGETKGSKDDSKSFDEVLKDMSTQNAKTRDILKSMNKDETDSFKQIQAIRRETADKINGMADRKSAESGKRNAATLNRVQAFMMQ